MLGFVIGLLLALCVYLVYDKFKPNVIESIEDTRTDEEKRKEKEYEEHYNNMMNYNAEKAYGGK